VSGILLKQAVDNHDGFVVFSPIINGVGGSLVTVQASRMATHLHKTSEPGEVPSYTRIFEWPWKALFYGTPYAKTAIILICISIPGHTLFIFIADLIHMFASTIGLPFVLSYLTASLIQVRKILKNNYVKILIFSNFLDLTFTVHYTYHSSCDVEVENRSRYCVNSLSNGTG
jgi:solute carrier family 41